MGRIDENQLNEARQKYLRLVDEGKLESPLPQPKRKQNSKQRRSSEATSNTSKKTREESRRWHWEWNQYYIMTCFAFSTACSLFVLHACDLFFGWPFFGEAKFYDYVSITCSGLLAFLSASVYRELPKCRRWQACWDRPLGTSQ